MNNDVCDGAESFTLNWNAELNYNFISIFVVCFLISSVYLRVLIRVCMCPCVCVSVRVHMHVCLIVKTKYFIVLHIFDHLFVSSFA